MKNLICCIVVFCLTTTSVFSQLWYLPNDLGTGPAVLTGSGAPAGYTLAVNQGCVSEVTYNDSWCTEVSWDVVCQNAYCACSGGCTDPAACNYDSLAACDDGSCDFSVGCTSVYACNYDPLAGCDDGSCDFTGALWYLPNNYYSSSSEPAVFSCIGAPAGYTLAASQACVQWIADQWWNWECVNIDWDQTCQDDYCACSGSGCTDPAACNYNPTAGCDDGSCDFLSCVGCTDPTADNYDPNATISCPTCCCYFDPSVLCGDGTFWSEELQECVVLCPGDLNFDGFVNTQDLLIFLSVFGLVFD